MVIKDNINVDDVFVHKTLGEVTYDKECLELDEKYETNDTQVRVRLESFIITTVYCEDLDEDNPEAICGACLKPKENGGLGMCENCIANVAEAMKRG